MARKKSEIHHSYGTADKTFVGRFPSIGTCGTFISNGEPDYETFGASPDGDALLTQLATRVRLKLGEEGMVIWYDSVTVKVIIFRNSHHMVVFTSFKEIENLCQVGPKGI